MWRCITDMFGYCAKKPNCDTLGEYVTMAGETHHYFPIDGCKNDPKKCKNYRSFSEKVKEVRR